MSIQSIYPEFMFDNYFEQCTDLMCILNNEGIIEKLNPQWFFILGFHSAELEGTSISKYVHPDDVENTLRFFDIKTKGETTNYLISRLLKRSGLYGWFQWNAFVSSKHIFCTIRDISSLRGPKIKNEKPAEDQHIRTSMFLQGTLEAISDGFLIVDPEGKIFFKNKEFMRIFNIPDELIAMNDDPVILKYGTQFLVDPEAFYKRVMEIYNTWDISEDILHFTDGKIVKRLSYPLRMDSENPGRIWVFRDITEIAKSEANLREQDEKIRKILSAAPVSIGFTRDGIQEKSNEEFYRLTGYSPEEVDGKDVGLFAPEPERSRVIQAYTASDKKSTFSTESQWIKKNGETIDIILKMTPLDQEDISKGSIFGALDITRRLRAEEEIKTINTELEAKVKDRTAKLETANKDLESFAYSVSHDLRAPLRHIDGFLNLLYSNIPDPGEKSTLYYNRAIASSKRMTEMIDDLLTFSKLGRKKLVHKEVNIDELIGEIISDFKLNETNSQIKWKVNGLVPVSGDRNMLKLVFDNLISNAIKYSSKESKPIIEIGSNELELEIEYYVKDNGVGFDMKYANKLFGVFQRLHSNDEFEGTGIGLANVKQILENHNGRIRAESELNNGTTFYIFLPK